MSETWLQFFEGKIDANAVLEKYKEQGFMDGLSDLSLFKVHGTLIRSMGSTQIKVFPEICFGKNFMLLVQRVKRFSQVIGGHKRSY